MIPHHEYTTVLNKEGWSLVIDFVEIDGMTSKPDDFINEIELRQYHEAVRNVVETFGFPIVGDMIHVGDSFCEVVGRWFEFPKKEVTLVVF